MESFTADELRAIEVARLAGRPLECPRCASPLDTRPVPRPPSVAYVRHRVMVACPRCGRHAAIDRD